MATDDVASFGTLQYPARLNQLACMLDVLVDLKLHFILADGIASDDIKAMVKEKVKNAKGRGLSVRWAQQYAILGHKVRLLATVIGIPPLRDTNRPPAHLYRMAGATQ
jgi:hypothetical protein